MKQKKEKKTIIHWISVYDRLPKTGIAVLTATDEGTIYIQMWSPEKGWSCSCCKPVKFWSYYNLPA